MKAAPPVVFITGGSSGIGAATAVAFARLGARVALVDVRNRAAAVVEQVRAAGGEALPLSADVREPEALDRAVGAVLERFGRIDALVANAGIADQSSTAAGDPARWRAVVETNVLGVLYSVRAVLPTMLERRRGHVFIVASVSGRETYVGEPVYIASKWAQVGFGHALRQEVAASTPASSTRESPQTRGFVVCAISEFLVWVGRLGRFSSSGLAGHGGRTSRHPCVDEWRGTLRNQLELA